jgi:hypothetical protein
LILQEELMNMIRRGGSRTDFHGSLLVRGDNSKANGAAYNIKMLRSVMKLGKLEDIVASHPTMIGHRLLWSTSCGFALRPDYQVEEGMIG